MKNNIIKEKKKFKEFIEYLIDLYYLNPKNEFNIEKIKKQLKIDKCLILEEFIIYLKKEKYIKFKKNNFIITYSGFNYLENVQNLNKQYGNNLISIVISMSALLMSSFSLIWSDSAISKIILSIVLIIFIIYMFKIINDILEKKYY